MRIEHLFAAAVLLAISAGCTSHTKEGQEAVRETLLDPGSAQFRNVHDGVDRQGGWIVCGEVNAKNRMGGYTGYRRFSVSEKKGDVLFANNDTAEGMIASVLMDGLCKFPKGAS